MVIIFYDCANKTILIATEQHPIKAYPLDTPNISQFIPNDDILYVETGSFYTKNQFVSVIYDKVSLADNSQFPQHVESTASYHDQPRSNEPLRYFVHTTGMGTVVINDIKVSNSGDSRFDALKLEGKWKFFPMDKISKEQLENSHEFRTLERMGKIEVVDTNYINAHREEISRYQAQTAAERELSSVLVPPDIKAEAAARKLRRGENLPGRESGMVAVPIIVN